MESPDVGGIRWSPVMGARRHADPEEEGKDPGGQEKERWQPLLQLLPGPLCHSTETILLKTVQGSVTANSVCQLG